MGKMFYTNILGLMMIAALVFGVTKYMDSTAKEFEAMRVSEAIDNSTEAALATMLITQDLTPDYTSMSGMNLDPYVALDTFVSNLLKNYNLADTPENRMGLKLDNIPVFVVTTGDGYYIAKIQQAKKSANGTARFDLVFSPKKPYTYTDNTGIYGITVNNEYYYTVLNDGQTKYTRAPLPGFTAEDINIMITKHVVEDMKATIDSYMDTNYSGMTTNFYMPAEASEMATKETNIIEGPSVLTIVQNLDFGFKQPLNKVSVAGNKITLNRQVVGFMESGVKYYTFSDLLPTGVTIQETFDDLKDAAKSGYTPHLKTLE